MKGALLLLLAGLAWAEGLGWRSGGTGLCPGTGFPESLTVAGAGWSTPVSSWGNASPVAVGSAACITVEPHEVVCVDMATGAVRSRTSLTVVDALPEAERAALAPRLADADGLADRLEASRRDYSRLRREARAGGVPVETMEAKYQEIESLQKELEEISPYQYPDDKPTIGYTSPTPVSDGRSLFVLFGNGVLFRLEPDGRVAWSRWLGLQHEPMRGYSDGHGASPSLVDGVLVVPYGHLQGIDPATGRTLWEGDVYEDFGTPAPITVGGVGAVVTPGGKLVRARDGREMASGLGDLWYVGPQVLGDRAWFVGGTGYDGGSGGMRARAWRFVARGDVLEAQPLWEADIATRERIYAMPVVSGDLLHVVTADGTWIVLDAQSGAERHREVLPVSLPSKGFSSPIVSGDELMVVLESGEVFVRQAVAPFAPRGHGQLEGGRATPLVTADRMIVRDRTAVRGFAR